MLGALVGLAIGLLVWSAMQSSAVYYLTPAELRAKGLEQAGRVRVAGRVLEDTLSWDSVQGSVSFTLAEGQDSIPVRYAGPVPDTFREGASVVVEGKYSSAAERFDAHLLMTKCPSRYETRLE